MPLLHTVKQTRSGLKPCFLCAIVLVFHTNTRGLEAFTRMIFFKFSGISLVSAGRERPGNEI